VTALLRESLDGVRRLFPCGAMWAGLFAGHGRRLFCLGRRVRVHEAAHRPFHRWWKSSSGATSGVAAPFESLFGLART
jgi:hypothetical protein